MVVRLPAIFSRIPQIVHLAAQIGRITPQITGDFLGRVSRRVVFDPSRAIRMLRVTRAMASNSTSPRCCTLRKLSFH